MTAALKSRAERYKYGRELRARTPREAHAQLHGLRDRDPVAILAESDPDRVAELLPERYKRMMADPFGFLRGAAAVMAADLAHEPTAGAPVQACGDCHLMNFGAFNSPEDSILFDINDFDETLPGVDFTVDVKRLAASVAVAAGPANLSDKRARSLAAGAVAAYRELMFGLVDLSPLEIWHSRIDLEQELKQIESPALRRSLSTVIPHAVSTGMTTFPISSPAASPGSPTSRRQSSTSVRRRSGAARSTLPARLRFTARRSRPTGPSFSTAID